MYSVPIYIECSISSDILKDSQSQVIHSKKQISMNSQVEKQYNKSRG